MLFHVRMDVAVPHDLDPGDRTTLLAGPIGEHVTELARSSMGPAAPLARTTSAGGEDS